MIRPKIYILFMIIASTGLLSACDQHKHFRDLQKYIIELKKTAKNKQTARTIRLQSSNPVTYQANHLRAPFNVPEEVSSGKLASLNPLQVYALNMLRFVGTVSEGGTINAFIMTPDNMIYRVKEGDLIGNHEGRVLSIDPDRLNVMEQNAENGSPSPMIQQIVTLQLKDEH